jgi:drug/metabolite transporter (DMT)-like permease
VINLLLAITLTSLMYFIFKSFDKFKVQTFQAIAVNYVVCVITAIVFSGSQIHFNTIPKAYLLFPFGLAISFILGFNLLAYSLQKISVCLSTAASRLSLIIPILFGTLLLNTPAQHYSIINTLGIILVVIAIALISIPQSRESLKIQKEHLWLLPTLFLLTGSIDTLLAFTNELFQKKGMQESLPLIIFGFSSLLALSISLIYKKQFKRNDIIGGIALGIPNFFSVYYLIKALTAFNNDTAFVFSINNLCVIVLTTIISITVLKERISHTNISGIIVSIIALLFLIY